MKKIVIIAICAFVSVNALAQQEEVSGGFKKDHLFTGGNVAFGFGSGQTSFGLGPYFGYSINRYVDVAVSVNYNYVSVRDFAEYGDKIRQSVIGPGFFTRLYPVKFLFAQAQFEQNFIKLKYIPADNGFYQPEKETRNVSSFLIGPGYAGGREDGGAYYYISVLFDVAKNKYSPYVDELGRVNPIFRAGVNIPLFQGGRDRGRSKRFRNRY